VTCSLDKSACSSMRCCCEYCGWRQHTVMADEINALGWSLSCLQRVGDGTRNIKYSLSTIFLSLLMM
jgi:hypothetical protein